jgi:hypothetical protein
VSQVTAKVKSLVTEGMTLIEDVMPFYFVLFMLLQVC